jgi:membrane AbrB-like protein
MPVLPSANLVLVTFRTLAIAAFGAGAGYLLSFPAYLLTGPALAVSLAGLSGVRLEIMPWVRDVAFLVIGVGIGSTVTAQATAALMRWPLAFVALAVALAVMMALCQMVLQRVFGFDRRSAVLAAAPGHLSFVIGLSAELNIDVVRVTVVQSVRLLGLTLGVPLIARFMGVEISASAFSSEYVLSWAEFAVLMVLSLGAGWALRHLRVPAALLIGAMMVSSVAHGSGMVTGGLQSDLGFVAFVTLGALIGTRFSGVSVALFRSAVAAGLVTTFVASAVAVVATLPVAAALGMPVATVLAAFAPGGFETMIALGAVLGGNPGFVAACHVARLMILTGLIPLMLARADRNISAS